MITLDLRDNKNYRHFSENDEIRVVDGPLGIGGRPTSESRCILLIHGYNGDPNQVDKVYNSFVLNARAQCPEVARPRFFGVQWPSNGAALAYRSDFRDAQRAGMLLSKYIDKYMKSVSITIVSHSMGAEVARIIVESLALLSPRAAIDSVVLMGADIRVSEAESLAKLTQVVNLYSSDDRVVGFLARLMRPGLRAGRAPVRGAVNYDMGAQGNTFYHSDYWHSSRTTGIIKRWL